MESDPHLVVDVGHLRWGQAFIPYGQLSKLSTVTPLHIPVRAPAEHNHAIYIHGPSSINIAHHCIAACNHSSADVRINVPQL